MRWLHPACLFSDQRNCQLYPETLNQWPASHRAVTSSAHTLIHYMKEVKYIRKSKSHRLLTVIIIPHYTHVMEVVCTRIRITMELQERIKYCKTFNTYHCLFCSSEFTAWSDGDTKLSLFWPSGPEAERVRSSEEEELELEAIPAMVLLGTCCQTLVLQCFTVWENESLARWLKLLWANFVCAVIYQETSESCLLMITKINIQSQFCY